MNELMHYGVPGMKWGHRKAVATGSITKNGKYKASNGIVIAKSKNVGVAAGRKLSTTTTGRALSAVGSIGLNKNQKARMKKEQAALKEYYREGGDKMFKRGETKTERKQNRFDSKMARRANRRIDAAELRAITGESYNQKAERYKIKRITKGKDYANKFAYKHAMKSADKFTKRSEKQIEKAKKSVDKMSESFMLSGVPKIRVYTDGATFYSETRWSGNKVITKKEHARLTKAGVKTNTKSTTTPKKDTEIWSDEDANAWLKKNEHKYK